MHNEHCYFDMGITPPFRNWWNWCEPLPTDDQKADLFTKLLDNKRLEFLCQNIGVILKEWSLLFLLLSHAFASSFMICVSLYIFVLLLVYFAFMFWVSLILWFALFNMFLFVYFSVLLYFIFHKKNWKIRKIQK